MHTWHRFFLGFLPSLSPFLSLVALATAPVYKKPVYYPVHTLLFNSTQLAILNILEGRHAAPIIFFLGGGGCGDKGSNRDYILYEWWFMKIKVSISTIFKSQFPSQFFYLKDNFFFSLTFSGISTGGVCRLLSRHIVWWCGGGCSGCASWYGNCGTGCLNTLATGWRCWGRADVTAANYNVVTITCGTHWKNSKQYYM